MQHQFVESIGELFLFEVYIYLTHLSKLSAAEASCMAPIAAALATSLCFMTSCHKIHKTNRNRSEIAELNQINSQEGTGNIFSFWLSFYLEKAGKLQILFYIQFEVHKSPLYFSYFYNEIESEWGHMPVPFCR